jgi:hypothetical protein
MCVFSRPVQQVAATKIFARLQAGPPHRQILVYEMAFSANEDLAMLLPIPTPPGTPEDGVTFVSLEAYPEFFVDMAKGFPGPPRSRGAAPAGVAPTLEVKQVGAFEASFVPSRADFARLDERFRLPEAALAKLPCPDDYGFAVFKLKAGEGQRVHPMAFSFPTRNPRTLFFPTAHLHGDAWERRVLFDHTLYYQGSPEMRLPLSFDTGTHRLGRLAGKVLGVQGGAKAPETSPGSAKDFLQVDEERALVDGDLKVHKFELRERLPNRDVVLWPKYHERAGEYP